VHWKRLHPERGFQAAAADLGLPLTLATLTTVIGFGSLATSRVPGLRHAGILVALGLSACLLATVLVLPALEAALGWGRGRGRRRTDSWDNRNGETTDSEPMGREEAPEAAAGTRETR
jgi:predicted RND superfamily exporter protein